MRIHSLTVLTWGLLLVTTTGCLETNKDQQIGAQSYLEKISTLLNDQASCKHSLVGQSIKRDLLSIRGQSGNTLIEVGKSYKGVRLLSIEFTNKNIPTPEMIGQVFQPSNQEEDVEKASFSLMGTLILNINAEISQKQGSNVSFNHPIEVDVSVKPDGEIMKCL